MPPEAGELSFSEALGYVRTLAARRVAENPEEEIVSIGVNREIHTGLWAYHYHYRYRRQPFPTSSTDASAFGQLSEESPTLTQTGGGRSEE